MNEPALHFVDLKSQYQALKPQIAARMQRVLDHGQYIMGPEVLELEAALAAFSGARHCITVASGTEALLISLMALNLQPGDEVVTTPFTFAATAEMIVLLGGKPVFADIDISTCNISTCNISTCNINAALIEAKITPQTRAIMPVSLYGQCADMDTINAIAAKHRLPVIEDAAQSFGARYRGRRSGNLSTLGCTSFFPSKPLGCYGDGGAIFTNDDVLAQACRDIRVHGQSRRYEHTRLGVGGRMDTLQCAIVLAKLERFEWELQQRHAIGARYHALLADVPGLQLINVPDDQDCVWAQYTVLLDHRTAVQKLLKDQGIPTAVHYPQPVHHQPAYAALCCADCCPNSVLAAQRVMSLPMSADLSPAQQDRVVLALRQAMRAAGSA
jgi:UDP-2-acetamido-2-deoxy-ribo-hexuluronate aminotransferase